MKEYVSIRCAGKIQMSSIYLLDIPFFLLKYIGLCEKQIKMMPSFELYFFVFNCLNAETLYPSSY